MRGTALAFAAATALILPAAVLPGPLWAQQQGSGSTPSGLNLGTTDPAPVRSAVLTVDPDGLFEGSLFGQRILSEVRAETEALAAENRSIEAELTEEEQRLTERRATMEVAAFRAEAEAFDQRVQAIRSTQDAKERALQRLEREGRDRFLISAQPILARIMLERGAAVILDRRSVFLGFGAVDVTEQAISAINAELGDGAQLEPGGQPQAIPETLPGAPVPADQ